MLSLVSLALFGTAHAQNCGISLHEASPMMMFSSDPASYACTNWIHVNFEYTGSVRVFGRRGCGAVLFDEDSGTQSTIWSNNGGTTRHYPGQGKRVSYYYLLCPGDSVSHAMATRPGGRRLEQLPTLQRRLNGDNYGEVPAPEFDEAEALDDYDFGADEWDSMDEGDDDLWIGGAGLGALDVNSFGNDDGYYNGYRPGALTAAADTAGIVGLVGLGALAFGEDMYDGIGEDLDWDDSVSRDDEGDDDLWVGGAGLGALDVNSFGNDDGYYNGYRPGALTAAADTAGIVGLVGLGALAFGEDEWDGMGEDMYDGIGEDLDWDEQEDIVYDGDFGSSLGDEEDCWGPLGLTDCGNH